MASKAGPRFVRLIDWVLESDIVEMDEAGFLQMLTDLKTFKTLLLKLKRELQEVGWSLVEVLHGILILHV